MSDKFENPEKILTADAEADETQAEGIQSEIKGDNEEQEIDLVTVSGVRFAEFEEEEPIATTPQKNLDIMQDVHMKVTVELGRTKSSVKKVLDMAKGSIVELNKVAGEPVELFVNDKLVAYGEVIVMEEKFGLRVTNIAKPKGH